MQDLTPLHRQLILDAILMQDNFAVTGDPDTDKQADDIRWYFQQWRPSRQQSNLRLRHPGNSVTEVDVVGENMTAFQYIREKRLSQLGHEKSADTQKFVAWNLERSTNLSNPADKTMYQYLINSGDGGLKKRIKKFSLLSVLAGEVGDDDDPILTRDQLLQVLKDGFGVDARVADMIEQPEKYQELVIEHLNALGTDLAQQLQALTGVESDDVKETYEKILKHYQELGHETGKLEETIDEALEKILEAIPDSGSDQCF